MNGFKSDLKIVLIGDQNFELLDELIYENKDFIFIIKKGFTFDGASIPRILWTTIGCPFGASYTKPACLHDALYATKLFSREQSDDLFLEAMLATGVDKTTAEQMHTAVRLFGKNVYEEEETLDRNRDFIEIKSKGGLW